MSLRDVPCTIGYLDPATVVDGFANSMPHHHPTGGFMTCCAVRTTVSSMFCCMATHIVPKPKAAPLSTSF